MPNHFEAWVLINKMIGSWPPSEMWSMSFDELYGWFDKAVEIAREKEKAQRK